MLLSTAIFALGVLLALAGGYLTAVWGIGDYLIAGVVAIMIAVLITVRANVGAYVLVVFIYLNLSHALEVTFGIPSINKPVVGVIAVAVLANRVFLHRMPIVFTRVEAMILLYGIILLFSALTAQNQEASFDYILDWLKDFALLMIIVQLSVDEHTWKTIHWLFILSAAFLSLLSTYQMLSGDFENEFFGLAHTSVHQITNEQDDERVMGPLSDPNYYGQIIMMAFPLAAYRALTDKLPSRRILAAICAVLIMLTVVFTYSRATFLAMVIISTLIIIERRINFHKVVLVITTIIVVALPIIPSNYFDRILTLGELFSGSSDVRNEASFRGRTSEFMVGIQMFLDYPVFGVGVANYESNYLIYSPDIGLDGRNEEREAHSLPVEILAETGLVGFISFAAMMVTIYVSLGRAKARLKAVEREGFSVWVTAMQLSLTSFMITSLFLHNAYSRYMWMSIGLAAGGLVVTEKIVNDYHRRHTQQEAEHAALVSIAEA
jgi:putative inorganic carbon (hco3(-)) transporter